MTLSAHCADLVKVISRKKKINKILLLILELGTT